MTDALIAGKTASLAPGIRRLVAPNPGMMTGPGTNTYLLGETEIAVIDPGPAIDEHIERILSDAGAPIRWLLATHTHPDHSPAVAKLARRTNAEIIGLPAPEGPHQDTSFKPDRQPADGELLCVDGLDVSMLHTPGHASNHVCYFIESRGWLFTGDHVINGSTVVIDPPDGSMSAYLDSLGRLRELELSAIAGGHGPVIDAPYAAIDWLIDHRLEREAKVRRKLNEFPGRSLGELVTKVYDEIDPSVHGLAERSLLAHLEKLVEDGRARNEHGRWLPVGTAESQSLE